MPTLTLTGTEVLQGNGKGKTLQATDANRVLFTTDLVGCVAVCGFNGTLAFMIHSDSQGTGGIGGVSLINGLNALVSTIGDGTGYTITLFGGSMDGTKGHLERELPRATVVKGAESDAAYITSSGAVASTRARLATALGVDSVTIDAAG